MFGASYHLWIGLFFFESSLSSASNSFGYNLLITETNKISDNQNDNYGIYDEDYDSVTRNISRRKLDTPSEWELTKRHLNFPKNKIDNNFKMGNLIIENQLFKFQFLHDFLRFIQPYNVSIDFLIDIIERRVTTQRLLSESMHVEVGFISLLAACCILACVIPGTELWLACRPIKEDYKPSQHPRCLAFMLSTLVFILGIGIIGLIISNEVTKIGIEKIPNVMNTAIQDLNDYHTGTTVEIRDCLTRSLDVASEAMMADLDNVEELLGKPVQLDLASETGLDIAIERLFTVANASQTLSNRAETLLKEGEKARDLGMELSREIDGLRRQLESVVGDCITQDRSVCATINPSGLSITIKFEQLLRDQHLLRLQKIGRDNLTEAGRQARGEYHYVPHYISRSTLEYRNNIRREINAARVKIFEEARSLESTNTELNSQLNSIKKIANEAAPYIQLFEEIRWLICIGAIAGLTFIWILLFFAIICQCGSSQKKVKSTLLCGAFWSCPISIGLCMVLAGALGVSSHMEMFVCRALEDPSYKTLEAVLETRMFLGQRLNVPLKDLLEKCEQNEGVYPAFPLGQSSKLEQLADYWKWSGLSKSLSSLKVDLKGLKILTPSLEEKLESILHACGPNLTEHRTYIRGSILNKDLGAMSEHLHYVARQLVDKRTSRNLQDIGESMKNILDRRVRPLVQIQDNLVDQLTRLELQLRPFQDNINKTFIHMKNIQSHIDKQGDVIAELRTKYYIETLNSYLDQWRTHVLTEVISGPAKCRPLWDIVNGLRLSMCQDVLGPLDGFWFLILISIIIMAITTPMAHILSSVYRNDIEKTTIFTPPGTGSPDTVVIDRDTWRTPDPPPLQDDW